MRNLFAAAAALALIASQALAAGTPTLAPGKPAGVKKAQDMNDTTILYVLGGAAVIGGIVALSSGNSNGTVNNGTTGGTTTTTTST